MATDPEAKVVDALSVQILLDTWPSGIRGSLQRRARRAGTTVANLVVLELARSIDTQNTLPVKGHWGKWTTDQQRSHDKYMKELVGARARSYRPNEWYSMENPSAVELVIYKSRNGGQYFMNGDAFFEADRLGQLGQLVMICYHDGRRIVEWETTPSLLLRKGPKFPGTKDRGDYYLVSLPSRAK